MIVAPPLPKAPPVRCLHTVKGPCPVQSAAEVQAKGPVHVPSGLHWPTSWQAMPSFEPPTQTPKEVPSSTPQKPQKTCWLFMSVAVLCAAGAVESVVSENGMGSL